MNKQQIWASCESCGLAWTERKELPTYWVRIECPKCKHKTNNFDTENHNKRLKFKNITN